MVDLHATTIGRNMEEKSVRTWRSVSEMVAPDAVRKVWSGGLRFWTIRASLVGERMSALWAAGAIERAPLKTPTSMKHLTGRKGLEGSEFNASSNGN